MKAGSLKIKYIRCEIMVGIETKNMWWNHFVERWIVDGVGGFHGLTGPRLRKVKKQIFKDHFFWNDIILRHGFESMEPENCKHTDNYDHCLGNFWGMICQTFVTRGLIKY